MAVTVETDICYNRNCRLLPSLCLALTTLLLASCGSPGGGSRTDPATTGTAGAEFSTLAEGHASRGDRLPQELVIETPRRVRPSVGTCLPKYPFSSPYAKR